MKKRVTLLDVAKHAGVSRATASLVVRKSNKISEETRKKVLQAIEELGYVYDRVAANMRSEESTTVGVIITDIANPFYVELLRGVHTTLDEAGYDVFLGTTFDSEEKQNQLVSRMLEHRVGGIILCPVSYTTKKTIEQINNVDLPIVHAVREFNDLKCDYVGIDYIEGAQLAVSHLINKGHRTIAFVGGTSDSPAWEDRKKGYKLAMEYAGIDFDESLIIPSAISSEGGMNAVNELGSRDVKPTAIFCFNDFVAKGVMNGLKKRGLEPGKDIAVVGFDNTHESSLYTPPLSTVNSFAKHIGSQAARLLYKRMQDKKREKQRLIIQPELVIRESS